VRVSPLAALAFPSLLLLAGDVRAGQPARADRFWAGLDAPRDAAAARGVIVLRVAPAGRVRIPGGSFIMGSTTADMLRAVQLCKREVLGIECDQPGLANAFRAEGRAHEVRLSSFFIDRTEVTVASYMRCVVTGPCARPGFAAGDARFDQPSFPVTHVRWEDAQAHCAWAGGRLPTEAEWEYAARGATSREYPWGAFYNPHLANHGSFSPGDFTDATDGFVGLAPVGSFPDGATPLGLLDMAGNAAEWVDEVFVDPDEEGYTYPAGPAVDPRPTRTGPIHIARGGSYLSGAAFLRPAARAHAAARESTVGFRCAADVTP
jgi:formylglycine-generating enzyme required for sulfatase activity